MGHCEIYKHLKMNLVSLFNLLIFQFIVSGGAIYLVFTSKRVVKESPGNIKFNLSLGIRDEEYYQMPRLFHLDDIEECLATRRGTFCLGTFDLLHHKNTQLLQVIKQFSADKYHFNHTHIHRGYCVSRRCAHVEGPSPGRRFERCVDDMMRDHYGLQANLTRLEYCRTGTKHRLLDRLDLAFAAFVGVIVLMNAVGTAYHLMWSQDEKLPGNRQLLAWSAVVNWRRLTADYSHGDPRLAALKPIQGMKVLTLLLVMMAHSVLAYHTTYIYNPQFLERASHKVLSVYFQNGTSIVQTFVMVSCFLLAYNLLLHADKQLRHQLSLKMLPQTLLYRVVRITPLYIFVLGTAMTWWAHSSGGPLWKPLIEDESARCRDKWWAQLLFVNNLVKPEEKCLIHTWFLAVDMQLYVVSAALVLALGRWPRAALPVLAALFLGSILANFSIAYHLTLKPMVVLMFPEYMRTQFQSEPSFEWLYTAPWDSAPAALAGLILAFLHHALQQEGFKPEENTIVRVMYRMSVPGMFLWVLGGYWVKGVTDPLGVALYAALDRPVFITLTALAMYGFINKIDSVWWEFLSWRGWEVAGRMSLSAYLVHWLHALTQLALNTNAARVSVYEITGHWLTTIFLSYTTALPLHLLVELPMQRFLQSLLW